MGTGSVLSVTGTMVVVKLDGPALLCKTDEVGELCLSSNFTGTGYWGLPGMSNTSFKVRHQRSVVITCHAVNTVDQGIIYHCSNYILGQHVGCISCYIWQAFVYAEIKGYCHRGYVNVNNGKFGSKTVNSVELFFCVTLECTETNPWAFEEQFKHSNSHGTTSQWSACWMLIQDVCWVLCCRLVPGWAALTLTSIQPASKWTHWAVTLWHHSDLFRAAISASSQLIPILNKSLLTVLLQLVHGRPGPLLNPGTSQCNACRGMRWWSIRFTCPSQRSLLSLSMSSMILRCPVLTLTSSCVRWAAIFAQWMSLLG